MRIAAIIGLMRQHWGSSGSQAIVLDGYSALGRTYPLTLADIALRNGVFGYAAPGATVFDRGVAEGRRQAALEIFGLAKVDPATLHNLIDTKPGGKS